MKNENGKPRMRIGDELRRRGYHGERASPRRADKLDPSRTASAAALTRRRFLKYGFGSGAMAGLSPLLTRAAAAPLSGRNQVTEVRTVFFNLSHEANFASKQYWLVCGGHKTPLMSVVQKPVTLVLEWSRNSFFRKIPKTVITHYVENLEIATDAVELCYIMSDQVPSAGTWTMSSIFMHIPSAAIAGAFALGSTLFGNSPRPLSAKRKKYGLGTPAASAIDLLEEHMLFDTTDHAAAMIGMHPEVLSADPASAAHIHVNHIEVNPFTGDLSQDITQAGPAQPQLTPGQPNGFAQGWATLRPFTDENGQQLRFSRGNNVGLFQYNAEWEPTTIAPDAGQALVGVVQTTKDDVVLGRKVTPASTSSVMSASARSAARQDAVPPDPANQGAIWLRRDGITSVIQDSGAPPASAGAISYTMTPSTPQAGYYCTAQVQQNPNGSPHVVLNFENTYLRWLGVFVVFYDGDKIVPVASLPPSLVGGRPSPDGNALFIGILTPEFTMYGIPAQSSTLSVPFDFPVGVATSAKILASGLGYGPLDYPEITNFGVIQTVIFNLVVPAILIAMAAGQEIDALIKLGIVPLVITSTQELFAFLKDLQGGTGYTNLLNIFVRGIDRAGPSIVVKFANVLAGFVLTGDLEDAIPIAGQIIAAIGALGAAAEIIETSVEVAKSPWIYESDLVLQHDLSITLKPAGDNTTPKDANHYKVTALFDNGATPRVLEASLPNPVSEVNVRFTAVPLGGRVNVSAAFTKAPIDPAQEHVLLGKATTGLVSNTSNTLGPATISEVAFPIGRSTTYQHSLKIVRAGSGAHEWKAAPAPATKASDLRCAQEGDLCDLYGITVRQGTATAPGYVGYGWRGNSLGVIDCFGQGQSDTAQLANLNTDTGGNGRNAQNGYAALACGLRNKPRLSYSVLANAAGNFYLDSTKKVVRQVSLGSPPQFVDPRSDQAWGAFNYDSTSLLLHPTGKLVSISQANHQIETLTLAGAAMSDADARVSALALVHAGKGSRPGLLKEPVAAAISPDGVVLVLEQMNNRIQAFDIGANPVPYFSKLTSTPYFLQLDATKGIDTVYLDLAVEYTGFMYVLSYNLGTNVYRLDIYHSSQATTSPISTTMNVNAGKLTVDFWRNVYTLNYEVLQSSTGQAEPSVSLWVPSNAS